MPITQWRILLYWPLTIPVCRKTSFKDNPDLTDLSRSQLNFKVMLFTDEVHVCLENKRHGKSDSGLEWVSASTYKPSGSYRPDLCYFGRVTPVPIESQPGWKRPRSATVSPCTGAVDNGDCALNDETSNQFGLGRTVVRSDILNNKTTITSGFLPLRWYGGCC